MAADGSLIVEAAVKEAELPLSAETEYFLKVLRGEPSSCYLPPAVPNLRLVLCLPQSLGRRIERT